MDRQPKLLRLDETEESRTELSLVALRMAGEGTGPRAAGCRAAYAAYQERLLQGEAHSVALGHAQAVLASHRKGS